MSLRQGPQTRLYSEISNDWANCRQLSFFHELGEDSCVCNCLHSMHAADRLTGGAENVSRLLLELLASDNDFCVIGIV